MKIPLSYQHTEFDCGPTALKNCISFLYEREEIPAKLCKIIAENTLDADKNGRAGEAGTSRQAMAHISNLISNYSKSNNFDLQCVYCFGADVTSNKIAGCIKDGGVCCLRSFLLPDEHYFSVTGIDDEAVYIFDPYYMEAGDEVFKNKNYEFTSGRAKHNRRVKLLHFIKQEIENFCLGPVAGREALLFYRKKV